MNNGDKSFWHSHKMFIDTKSVIGYIGENFMKHGCLFNFNRQAQIGETS